MFSLDIRTVTFSYALITIICTFVIILLLRQYRSRYKGVPYILSCFTLQTLSLILIFVRSNIPVWISFDLANTISVIGIIFFYVGIEAYTRRKSTLIPNLILLSFFILIQVFVTFWKPSLAARHLNISAMWLIVFAQCTWLLLYRVPRSKLRLTFPVSVVCTSFCLVCLARIIKFLITGYNIDDYSNSDRFDTVMILISQILLILLTYSLEHMFGSQVLSDIKSEEEKFSKAFYTSPYGIIITSFPDGRITDINKGFQNITGYCFDEVSGKTTSELHFWFSDQDRNTFIEDLYRTCKVYEREFRFRKKSGEIITCLLSSQVIFINDEKCILSSVDDISARKKYELELIESKEKAEESDRLKTAFIHNVSHEIRTPLNAIVGFSTLLTEPDITPEVKQSYIDIIIRSSDHLLLLVSDIMEISNIEAGNMKFNEKEINLNVILNDLYKQFKPMTINKGIDLRVTKKLSDNNSYIHTDSTKLVQILTNLLINALKFTDKGHIEFGYILKDDHIQFHVSDTGIGIREELHDKIFDRFYQVDYSGTRKYDGNGLGLSICKAYIELSDGKIWVDSKPGKGATFYFTIPYLQTGQHSELSFIPTSFSPYFPV